MEHTKISEHFDILTWIPNIGSAQVLKYLVTWMVGCIRKNNVYACNCFWGKVTRLPPRYP